MERNRMLLRCKLYSVRFSCAFFAMLLNSCATYHAQSGSETPIIIKGKFNDPATVSHSFILFGDAGKGDEPQAQELFSLLEDRLQKADTNTTLLFLGDNIYEKGMPPKGSKDRKIAEERLNRQLQLTRNFKGHSIFIPGNHDWYNGIAGVREQEKLVTEFYNDPKSFLPTKTCGIESVSINSNVALIAIDSYWFLQDWDKLPEINSDCEIRTREQFFDELEKLLTANQNKTTILAIHHPLLTHGSHGGEFPFRKHIFPLEQDIPLPVIGTIANILRKTSGISVQDIQNVKYNAMAKRIRTLIAGKPNVLVVSGHDHNLQYIDQDNIHQVISGSGSKNEGARAINDNDFSYGRNGYAVVQVLKSGGAKVSFYGIGSNGKEALLAEREPLFAPIQPNLHDYPNTFAATKDTSVYSKEMTTKKSLYRFLWGNHYRKQYARTVHVRQVSLDTLYGGLKPVLTGDDEQARSLTLQDKNGKQYVMRALRKSATRFLQSVAFKDQSVEADFRNTYTEDFILDFYTTAHPYFPLVVSALAERADVSHSNPKLYFVPKQNGLGLFNEDFGNELYLIEENPTDKLRNLRSFGRPDRIIGTEELLANLTSDAKYSVDHDEYIKARLFDMLIGDWDRDQDQWRWGEYHSAKKIIYRPIPLNRDHAFTKFDGALFKIIMNFPFLRHMKTFDENIKKINWFNRQAYALDLALIPDASEKDWTTQAELLKKNLSDADIDRAFTHLPKEMQDATADELRGELKIRKAKLAKFASRYFDVLQKVVPIVGSDKKDRFVVTSAGDSTTVKVFQKDGDREILAFDASYSNKKTKELWLYGLAEDDTFELNGTQRKIRVRLIGGADKDIYSISDGKKVKVYDFISTDNDLINAGNANLALSDFYERNTYDYKRPRFSFLSGYPNAGFNPDDGIKLGAVINYNVNAFNAYPLYQKHSLGGNYYFATGGYEFSYEGTFPHLFGKWDLVLDMLYTSPNFSVNFFGYGNETQNLDSEFGKDYNRVKISTAKASPSLRLLREQSVISVGAVFERNRVDRTSGRFISEPGISMANAFDFQNFATVSGDYTFANYDNVSNPTLGMTFKLLAGYTVNLNETDRQLPFAQSSIGITYKLSTTGNWVLATNLNGKALFSNDFEFYQAATVGGDNDLRGYRNQRFTGKQSFYQSTDIRWNLGKFKNGLAPVYYGLFGGFDYGRVWLDHDGSEKWHQSAGGGLWLNGINVVTAKLSYFYSGDGGRLSFGLGFGF